MGKVSEKIFEANSKLPDSMRKHTDKLIRAGYRASKRIKPIREDTRRKGEAWVSRHLSIKNPLKRK